MEFLRDTPENKQDKYKKDAAFFLKLRTSVKRRYAEEIDHKEYERKVQKLLDTHVKAEGIQQITAPVNIFEREQFQTEIEKLATTASKADTIAHRTQRTITERMDEDPVFYRRFSKVLQEAIDAYHKQRIDEVEYLNKAAEVMNSVLNRTGDSMPTILQGRSEAKALYGVVNEVLSRLLLGDVALIDVASGVAVAIDDVIRNNLVVDWPSNSDVQNTMRNEIDDLLYDLKEQKQIALTEDDMDAIVERTLEIAKVRYSR
jgi:type I restriction enzyme R subunit